VTCSTDSIATPGTWQTFLYGNWWDGFLAKFDSSGQRQWGTYYGDGDTEVKSCSVDHSGHVIIAGGTTCNDLISSPGTFEEVKGGGIYDGYVSMLNTLNGQRYWGTFYGGNHNDYIYGCTFTPDDKVYIAGMTASTNVIASVNAFQPSLNGSTDGFIGKLDLTGNRIWGTYYGGTLADSIMSCAVDDSNNVYVAGLTRSLNNISTLNAYQQNFAGGVDGLLAKFDSSGSRVWGT
jgi:hypothetical protein